MIDDKQDCWLTTLDNPYNPFTQFDEWYQYDITYGYDTCGYLARIAKTSSELSDTDYDDEVNRAIDEILKYNPLNIYVKVKKEDKNISSN